MHKSSPANRPNKPHWWLGLPVHEDGTHWYKNFDNDAFTPWPDTAETFVSIEDLPKDNMLITTVSIARCQRLVKISQHNTVSRSCNEVQSSFNDKRVVPNTLVWKYRISATIEIHQYNMRKMKSEEALFLGRSSNGLRIGCTPGRWGRKRSKPTAFPIPLVWFWTAQSRAGCSCDRRSELFQWLSSHSKLLITVWARHLEKFGYFAFLQLVCMAFSFLCTLLEKQRIHGKTGSQHIYGLLRKGEKQVVTYCVIGTLKVSVLWNTKQKTRAPIWGLFVPRFYGKQNSSGPSYSYSFQTFLIWRKKHGKRHLEA